jgi:hypothetical protein
MAVPHLRQNLLPIPTLITLAFPSFKYCTEILQRLRPQGGDEMTQLVFDLGRRCHCVRNFFTQELPVTLSQPMKGLFHGVLGHAKLARNLSL